MPKLSLLLIVSFLCGAQTSLAAVYKPISAAKDFNFSAQSAHLSNNLPAFVSTGVQLVFDTADTCDTVVYTAYEKQLLNVDELNAHAADLDFNFSPNCYKTDTGHTSFGSYGYILALNDKGAQYLNDRFGNGKVVSMYGTKYELEPVISSVGTLSVGGINLGFTDDDAITGIVAIPWYDADPRINALVDELKRSEAPKRKELVLQLAQEIRPDLSTEKLWNELDAVTKSVNGISFAYFPIFQTKSGAYSISHHGWGQDYHCPAVGKCFQ